MSMESFIVNCRGEPTSEVPAQETENTAPGVAEHKGVDGEEEEEVNAEAVLSQKQKMMI